MSRPGFDIKRWTRNLALQRNVVDTSEPLYQRVREMPTVDA